MPEWLITLISVIVGAAIGIGGTELIQWRKRPKLVINFEERNKIKPYITDVNDYIAAAKGTSKGVYRTKYLRLKVHNKGKNAALNCEPKLELALGSGNDEPNNASTIHWSRRDYLLYTKDLDLITPVTDMEKAYAPIDINRDEVEYLEVLRMHYWYSIKPNKRMPQLKSELTSASVPTVALLFQPDTEYYLKVTVYSKNAVPVYKSFKIKWDGTVDGFNSDTVIKYK